jgi:hypothetical protein
MAGLLGKAGPWLTQQRVLALVLVVATLWPPA